MVAANTCARGNNRDARIPASGRAAAISSIRHRICPYSYDLYRVPGVDKQLLHNSKEGVEGCRAARVARIECGWMERSIPGVITPPQRGDTWPCGTRYWSVRSVAEQQGHQERLSVVYSNAMVWENDQAKVACVEDSKHGGGGC